ncbi:MAG: carbohydrate ABC transporter permease, partial [Chloroflexota bacterium]
MAAPVRNGMEQNGVGLAAPRSNGFVRVVGKWLRKPQFWFGFVTLVPLLVWYSVISFWSVIQAFRIALIHYRLIGTGRFVGLDNFRNLFADPLFTTSLKNSVEWGAIGILIGIPLALAIALCLVNVAHGRNLYQSLIFVPVVVPIVST